MTDRALQLIHTPRSHFARKVRLLLAALDVDVELIDAVNAAEADPARFGRKPLLKVPTLIEGGGRFSSRTTSQCTSSARATRTIASTF